MNEKPYQLIKVIEKLRLFKDCEPEDIEHLLRICSPKTYEADQMIYKSGRTSQEMLILLTGKLRVVSESGELLATIRPGSSVGEMGVFTGRPRSADIVAAAKSTGLAIGKMDILGLLEAKKDMQLKVLKNLIHVLSERLVAANLLNNTNIQTIMKLQDQLVKHTGKTSRELEIEE